MLFSSLLVVSKHMADFTNGGMMIAQTVLPIKLEIAAIPAASRGRVFFGKFVQPTVLVPDSTVNGGATGRNEINDDHKQVQEIV